MGEPTERKIEDTNLDSYNSKEATAARIGAASLAKEFKGAGAKAGIEVWRVKNTKRTEKKGPSFGVERVKDFSVDLAVFYSGDSYIVMETKINKSGKKSYDIHFWLGKNSSQDEIGVAAYRTVELDTLLGDVPVQYREVQGYESGKFLGMFKAMNIFEGGYESGFTQSKPEKYEPRLLWVRRCKKTMKVCEVALSKDSLNDGDVFILDAGKTIYRWVGSKANPFEKRKAMEISLSIENSRHGKAKRCFVTMDDTDSEFWKLLGGYTDKVNPATSCEDKKAAIDEESKRDCAQCSDLYKVSDESGKLTVTLVSKTPSWDDVHSKDVYMLDQGMRVLVLVGLECSAEENRSALCVAEKFLTTQKKPANCSIIKYVEGKNERAFKKALEAKEG